MKDHQPEIYADHVSDRNVTLRGGGASQSTIPAAGSSTGTDVSLRDYVDAMMATLEKQVWQRFDLNDVALNAALTTAEKAVEKALTSAEKAVEKALSAAKEAVDKAEFAAGKRFESTNEFRGQLNDQALTFQRLDLAKSDKEALQREISINRDAVAELRAQMAATGGFGEGEKFQKSDRRGVDTMVLSIVSLALVVIVPLLSYLVTR